MSNDNSFTGIQQVYSVSDALRRDCYRIIASTYHNDADYISDAAADGVNQEGDWMFSYTENNLICGFINGNFRPPHAMNSHSASAYIKCLYIDRSFHGRGIGSKLLNNYIEKLKKIGAESVDLYALESATGFYQKHNFKHAGQDCLMERIIIPKPDIQR